MPKSRFGRRAALIGLLGLSTAGLALAQQPYFRFNMQGAGTSGGNTPVLIVPKPAPTNDGKLDFGNPNSSVPFTLRALVGEPVSLEFGTIGGRAPITWLQGPVLPGGLIYTDGVIYGTPLAPSNATADFSAQDSTGAQAQARVTFDIYNAAVSLSLFKPVVRVGSSYSGIVSSNVADATYTVQNAPGASATSPNATSRSDLGGIATTPGVFPLSVSVSRPGTQIAGSVTSQVTVANPLAISFSPSTVPPLTGPLTVTATPQNVVGTGTLALQGNPSDLQARGLTYSNGTLSGNLGIGPATNLTLKLTDSADSTNVTASLTIPEIVPVAATIVIGESRPNQPVVAATGSSAPAMVQTDIPNPVCTVTQAVPGIEVSSGCVISGSPTAPGNYTLALSIVPAANPGAEPVLVSAPVVINPTLAASTPTPNVNPGPGGPVDLRINTAGVVGTPSFDLVGVTPEQLAAVGLAFDPATGSITGEIDPDVSLSPQVKLTDSKDGTSTTVVFTIVTGPASVSSGVTAFGYRSADVRTYTATSNIANATFSLVGAPDYVTIDGSSGVVTVTAPVVTQLTTIPGFAVRAQSATRPGVFKQATVSSPGTIRPELTFTLAPSHSVRGNVALTVPFSGTGASNPAAVVLATGNLPTGMTLGASSISGTPTVPATYSGTLRYTDNADGRFVDRPFEIVVTPSLDFTLASAVSPVGKGTIGTPMTITAQPVNTVGTISYALFPISGRPLSTLPAGLSLAAGTGTISGTPSASSNAVANIRMTETNGSVVTTIDKALTFAINAPLTVASTYPASMTTPTVQADMRGILHDATSAATTSSAGAVTYTITYPDEVTANGVVVSPGQALTVRNLDTNQTFNTANSTSSSFAASTGRTWTITVSSSSALDSLSLTQGGNRVVAPHLNAIGKLTSLAGNPVNIALTPIQGSTNGTATTGAFAFSADNLPAGLAINPTTGAITGTPTQVGVRQVVVSMTDSRGIAAASRTFEAEILPALTAATQLPVITGPADANALAKLYDTDAFDTNNGAGTSRVTFPAGATWTFTFPQAVTVNTFVARTAAGSNAPSFQIRNVDDGNKLVFNGTATASSSMTTSGGTTFTVYNYGSTSELAELAFSYASYTHVNLPYVSETAQRSYNGGTAANFTLRAATTYETGVPISIQPAATDAIGAQTWTRTGTLPTGMDFDASTGRIFGTPTQTGDFAITLAVSDSRGLVSAAKPMTFRVYPSAKASDFLPVLSGIANPDFARVAWHDGNNYDAANTDGTSKVTLAAGETVTFTFPQAVQANYLSLNFTSGWTPQTLQVRNESLNKVIFNGSSTGYFIADPQTGAYTSDGTVFTVRNTGTSAVSIANLAITWNGNFQRAPYIPDDQFRIAYVASGTPNFAISRISSRFDWIKDSYNRVIPTKANSTTTATWSYTGTIPPGMDFDASTGTFFGTATTPGDYAVSLTFTDGSGLTAIPKNLTFRIFTNLSAQTEIPVVTGLANPDLARAALMDGYSYDQTNSNGVSKVTLPAGATLTYTYAQTVRANYIVVNSALGQPTPDLEVRNATKNILLHTGSGNNYFNTVEGTNVSEGTTFTIRNRSASPVTLANMAITWNGAYPQLPYIGIDNYLAAYSLGGANNSFNTTSRMNIVAGAYLSMTPNYVATTGTRSFALVGTPPPGMDFDPATGRLHGTVNTAGEYSVTVAVTDTRASGAYASVPVTLNFKVFTNVTPSTVLPVLSGLANPTESRTALYDAYNYDQSYSNGISKVTIPAGATVTYTFPQTVRANYFYPLFAFGESAGNFEVRNETLNSVVHTGAGGSFTAVGGSNESEGSVFTVRNTSGRALSMAGMTINTNHVVLPYVNVLGKIAYAANAPTTQQYDVTLVTKQFLDQQRYYEFYVTSGGTQGTVTWSYSGTLPAGLDFNAANGRIFGTPSATGEYAITLTATDSRGHSSLPVPMSFRVFTNKTAANTLPTLSGPANPDLVRSALLDANYYDASYADGTSKYTLAAGETITYTFPETVKADGIVRDLALSSASPSLEVRNVTAGNAIVISGSGTAFTSVNGTTASEGSVFTIKNVSASPATFHRLAITAGSGHVTVPHVNDTYMFRTNVGGWSYPGTRTRLNISQGPTYDLIMSSNNGTGAKTMSLTGSLPPGMTHTPASGLITGVATASGYYPVQVTFTDANGLASVPVTLDIHVFPTGYAYNTIPTVTGVGSSPEDARARLMDDATTSSVNVPAGGAVTFTYPSEIAVNQVSYTGPSASLRVTNVTTGTVVYSAANQTSGVKTFTVGDSKVTTGYNVGSVFTVENIGASAVDFQGLSLSYGNNTLPYPAIKANASYTLPRAGAASVAPTYTGASGARTWSYVGTLPSEFTFNAGTGAISRSASSPSATTFNVTLRMQDSRGLFAVDQPVQIIVQ